MYNEITRKITSLTLIAVMVAGGLTFAAPGMVPSAYAAGELTVSAEAVGNFAGIQVLEIVVDDPDRDETDKAQGVPNVELNNLDVLMTQGNDGSWYGYVANYQAVNNYGTTEVLNTFYGGVYDSTPIAESDAFAIYNATSDFLDGFKPLSPTPANHPGLTSAEWPIIQLYQFSENTQVTISYGTGSTAETVTLTYDYDDDKDVSFDRSLFPYNAEIIASLDDSLLNLSPTADDYWAFNNTDVYYFLDDDTALSATHEVNWVNVGFEEGPLTYNLGSSDIFSVQNTGIHTINENYNPGQEGLVIFRQSDTDDNVFVNYDTTDKSNLITNPDTSVTGSGTLTYNAAHSVILDTFNAIINLAVLTDEWLSGIELDLELTDEDKNLNTRTQEDLLILDGEVPYIRIGNPVHLDTSTIKLNNTGTFAELPASNTGTDSKVFTISKLSTDTAITINGTFPQITHSEAGHVFSYINLDFTEFGGSKGTFYMGAIDGSPDNGAVPANVLFTTDVNTGTFAAEISGLDTSTSGDVYFDVLNFGQEGAVADAKGEINSNIIRVNDAFYRFQLEETDDNTAKFTGTVEYIMINQLNVFDKTTYDSIETADDQVVIIVNDDMDGVDAVRVSYNDVVSTGNDETISVQEDANTHSGKISMDKTGYSSGNTITITLEDADLNTNSDTPQIYQISNLKNWIGNSDVYLSQLTFNDRNYEGCGTSEYPGQKDFGLNSTSFSFIETSASSGIFTGTLRLPTTYCDTDTTNSTTNGVDIEWTYQDYSDASGNPNETHTSSAVQSNTGSVSLDKTVYGLPFGANQYATHPSHVSLAFLPATPTTLTIQVDDPDYNISANGEDTLPLSTVKVFVKRGSDGTGNLLAGLTGSFVETDPQSGLFEYDLEISQGSDSITNLAGGGFIKQGDIISIQYTDENDASGSQNTVTDSATFDLRNAVIQADKSVYIIGSDAIITLIEPDLNLDSETEETLSLELIEWDSDAGTTTLANDIFSAQPAGLRETGPNTGIFQVVIEIPKEVDPGDKLERGEQIFLEYVDNGPAGADYIGDDDEDITLNIFTSNFGATITLDQKVYTWTDKVFITIVAPDHNFDNNSIDEIGGSDKIVQINTRADKLKDYKFVETGADTGIFTGEVILTGFCHNSDGDTSGGGGACPQGDDTDPRTSGSGPTDGFIQAGNDDGLTVSFEFSDNETATGSALIRWNIGETQWLEASYPASGTGVVRVIDPDMNLNPESVDSFNINIWSDSSAGGIALRITETNEATGIFEGTIIFTTTDASSGSRLRVAEGDTVTAEYEDNTLPDPYSKADELSITATSLIGTIVPPLERAPATNLRAVDAFGNSLNTVGVDQQVQITADLSNGQDREQKFAYLLQVQNKDGVTVALSWITGELTSYQKLSPAVSWIPAELGTYTATVFVWESVDNPTALSPPVKTEIVVNN